MKPSILGLLLLLTWQLPATLIPGQNLARRIESSDSIVVAKMIRGTVRASGSQVSNDVVLRIERVLKGSLVAGTTVPARLEGRGMFIEPKPTETPASPLYGIWFLDCAAQPCTVVSRDGQLGTLDFAIVMLPEPAPAAQPGTTPAASVAAELATSLRWIAETHPSELTPRGTVSGPALSEFRSIVEGLLTLEPATMLAVMKPLTTEKSPALRVVGIQALIAANDPDGVKRAAADWDELAKSADLQPVIMSLMSYSNGDDPAAVRALGTLAMTDPALPGIRENATYALRAIHTKEALPALMALLDSKEERVRPYALSGVCLFVRNAPPVTPQSVPSMSWMTIRQPAPYLTPETEPNCFLGGTSPDLDAKVSFWKSWWSAHQAEIAALP